jgi:hypothetical protein
MIKIEKAALFEEWKDQVFLIVKNSISWV